MHPLLHNALLGAYLAFIQPAHNPPYHDFYDTEDTMKHRLFSLLSRVGLVVLLAVTGSAYAGGTSASIVFHVGTPPAYIHSGPVHYRHAPPPRHARPAPPPRQVWVPGHWETVRPGGYRRPPGADGPSRVEHHRAHDGRRGYYRTPNRKPHNDYYSRR